MTNKRVPYATMSFRQVARAVRSNAYCHNPPAGTVHELAEGFRRLEEQGITPEMFWAPIFKKLEKEKKRREKARKKLLAGKVRTDSGYNQESLERSLNE